MSSALAICTCATAQNLQWNIYQPAPDGPGYADDPAWYYPDTVFFRIPIQTSIPSGNPRPPALVTLSHDASRYINNAFNEFLINLLPNLSATCNANVVQKLHSARGFYASDLIRYLQKGAHFYYGDDSTVPTKGVITVVQSPDLYLTVRGEFKNDHHVGSRSYRTKVLTSAASFSFVVFFTRDAIHDSNSGRNKGNYATLFHESLHGLGVSIIQNYYDKDLLTIFGLDPNGATDQITNYIQKNCFE